MMTPNMLLNNKLYILLIARLNALLNIQVECWLEATKKRFSKVRTALLMRYAEAKDLSSEVVVHDAFGLYAEGVEHLNNGL